MDIKLLNVIINQFNISISNVTFKSISQGYINDTFLVEENSNPKYVLQRINSNIFKNVAGLHKNINIALKKLKASDYTELSLLKTKADQAYHVYDDSIWRLMTFVPNSVAYNYTSNKKIAFGAGKIISRFHQLLNDEDVNNYEVTLPNLNNLPFKITEFNHALDNTTKEIKENAKLEIGFAKQHLHDFKNFYNANVPERICHNDTKLNNILFNKTTHKGFCLIDLDTIMKGYFHYDFGDAVRTVVSETNEDEIDLTKIKFNLMLFERFIDGLKSNCFILSKKEIEYLPISCALMPFIHGLRAITDYLNGNIYYKVCYENQNLDRCKSLFHFTALALQEQESLRSIINNKLN